MTKIITAQNIDFGKVEEFQPKTMSGKILNIGTERVTISGLVSDNPKFVPKITEKTMEPKFPASSNIYFLNAKKTIQAANGVISTTDLGFGKAGTTDADGKFTFKPAMLSLSLTGPVAGAKYKLSESFNVTWTSSNITLVNIILESESGGYKIFEDVDASLGTLAVSILASDGFKINETVYIYIENTHQSIDDSVQVQSIATITINSPTLTAGTEGNVTGTSNGVEVDVYFRTSADEEEEIEAGDWEVFEEGVAVSGGNWSATGTIADADTYDFIAEDTTDRDGSAQVDDVVVASGVTFLGKYQFNDGDTSSRSQFLNFVDDPDEECFFATGLTRKDNFYGGGYADSASDNPFVMRIEYDGTVTWCKIIANSTSLSSAFNIFIDSTKVYTICGLVSGTQIARIARINKDGSNYNVKDALSSMQFSQIVGKISSDLIIVSASGSKIYVDKIADTFTNTTNTTRISSNESSGFAWTNNRAIHARLGTSDTLYVTGATEQANIQHAKIATVAYSDGAYNMANMTTAISKNTGLNYPDTYHICNDFLRGTGRKQYNAAGTHIYENGSDNIDNEASDVFTRCMKHDSDFYANGSTVLKKYNSAWSIQWSKTLDEAVAASSIIDLGDFVGVAGRTTSEGNFDGNNPSNTTFNAIIYIVKKDGTDL